MTSGNHTFNNIKAFRICNCGNLAPAKLSSQRTRSHYVSIRLNDAELSYFEGFREDLNRAIWICMSALKHPPPQTPEINLTVWKVLARASQHSITQ